MKNLKAGKKKKTVFNNVDDFVFNKEKLCGYNYNRKDKYIFF